MADPKRHRLRIASYNVHACIGTDGRFDPGRIARVIADLDADIIALQEVEDRAFRGTRVTAFLARELALQPVHGPTLMRGDAEYGNLLLARHEPVAVHHHDISMEGREARGAIEAEFRVAGSRLTVFATHFGLAARERRLQLGLLWPRLEMRREGLTVLCADLNEWSPFSSVHRALRQRFGASPAPNTFPSRAPLLALDRVYACPRAALVRAKSVSRGEARHASDHLPVVAELDPGARAKDSRRAR